MIRVVIPAHLRTLANVDGELHLEVDTPVTPERICDAIEASYPVLKGAIREHGSRRRRPWLRFFACEEDFSHQPPDQPLPETVAQGKEPFYVVGAIAGG